MPQIQNLQLKIPKELKYLVLSVPATDGYHSSSLEHFGIVYSVYIQSLTGDCMNAEKCKLEKNQNGTWHRIWVFTMKNFLG